MAGRMADVTGRQCSGHSKMGANVHPVQCKLITLPPKRKMFRTTDNESCLRKNLPNWQISVSRI